MVYTESAGTENWGAEAPPGTFSPFHSSARPGREAFDAAMKALERGATLAAADAFEEAARAFHAECAPERAHTALANLGAMRRQLGDLRGALQALDDASHHLAGAEDAQKRGFLLFHRAALLDRLNDPAAGEAWVEARKSFVAEPVMAGVCEAHTAGATLATNPAKGLRAARAVLERLRATATPALLAGLLGAVGESAGDAGVPFLAQAVLVMRRHRDAFNLANAPFLVLLAERLGLASLLCAPLCALGMILTARRRGAPDHGPLFAMMMDLIERSAAERSMRVATLLDEIEDVGSAHALDECLRARVAPELWLVAVPR
jgi:hypothetical protein